MGVCRRRLLAATASVGAASLAGCSGGCLGAVPLVGTGMPHDGEIATELAASSEEGARVVEFSTLPADERSLLRTAVEAGVVRACLVDRGSRAAALRSFADRAGAGETYLGYRDEHYGLWIRVEDIVHASTAEPPAGDANPCC